MQVGEAGVAGARVRCRRLAQRQVPARFLVHPGQRRAEHLGKWLLGPERREEQRLDQVSVGLQREPAAVGVQRGFERVEPGRDPVRLTRPYPYHPRERASRARGPGQPPGHQPVLGLGRLHHQPRDPGPGGGLEHGPDGLRLAGAGRAADEHVPVQRAERQRQRAGRQAVPVEDGADGDRLRAGRALLGDVELRPQRQPDPGHLALGRPGQRGEQPGARVERVGRHCVAPGRGWPLVVQDLPQAASGRAAGAAGRGAAGRSAADRDQGVRQPVEVGRGAHQSGHPRRGRRVGAAREQPDPPPPGRQAGLGLGVAQAQPPVRHGPFGEAIPVIRGVPLAPGQFVRYLAGLGQAQRLRDEQPAERARPYRQQALLQRGRQLAGQPRHAAAARAVSEQAVSEQAVGEQAAGEQAVADPGDRAPGRQPRHQAGQRAGRQRLGPRAARQRQVGILVVLAADQRRARGEDLNRPARIVPHPADRQGARAVALGFGSGVIRRGQRGDPLRPGRVTRLIRRVPPRAGPGAPRDLGDPVRAELVQCAPR